MVKALCLAVVLSLLGGTAFALDAEKLADAIFLAENSKSKPYGIMKDYCTAKTEDKCRLGCIQTINKRYTMYINQGGGSDVDFITYLSRSYCPIGAKNDPTGLNVNWTKNVQYFYLREK